MPTTSNFGWTTPADTDLVKDGAAAIRTLGNGIDTSLVDLKGGTTGQILSKNSNTDLDYTWVTPNVGDITEVQAGVGISVSSGTGPIPVITNSSTDLITTAGDILYGTAADTVARLGIGTAGQVLTVNSGATAPQWAAPAAGSTYCGVSVYNSAVQSINNTTNTAITFNDEFFDTDGFHSKVSNTSRLTVPAGKGGYYLMTAQAQFALNATGIREFAFRKNNVATLYTNQVAGSSSVYVGVQTTQVINLVAGDYIELFAYQSSGGALNFDSTSGGGVFHFSIQLLGA